MIPLQHRHGIFGERSAGIRERDRRGDPVFREEVIQAGQFLLDLRLGKLPQIRMVPGMIGDFESGGVELADLPAGHEETFVLRATAPRKRKRAARFLLPPFGFRRHRSPPSFGHPRKQHLPQGPRRQDLHRRFIIRGTREYP